MTPAPNLNKCCALSIFFYSKTLLFAFLLKNAFSERKLFLNSLELYLHERHIFRQKHCAVLKMA